MLDFPARSLARFFANHGLLALRDRPQWRTVSGGARRYIDAMQRARPFTVLTNHAVERIERRADSVHVRAGGQQRRFDHVVIAAHADDALRMLADPTPAEQDILGAFEYQRNEATLHTDETLMPARRAAWASWNYRVRAGDAARATVTYWMNRLQRLDCDQNLLVTLNDDGNIEPTKVLRRFTYHHPLFSSAAMAAQRRHGEISRGRTHYCGAYWGYGFHEDGVNSGLAAVETLELSNQACKAASTRAASATAASHL
jgi:predicted NAD/FAD-binding protein